MNEHESPIIELRYLRYFVAVAEEQSFWRAAERLHITPSALSMQIKKLEEHLGVQLCQRSTKKILLTPKGATLLEAARNLLRDAGKLVDKIRDSAPANQDCLRIGMTPLFGQSIITDAMQAYQSLHPGEKMDWVQVGMRQELLEALENGHVQIGFAYDFQLRHFENVEHRLVMDSPVHAVMGTHHPLASMKQVPLAMLARQKILCLRYSWLDFQDLPALFQEKHALSLNIKRVDNCNVAILAGIDAVTLMSGKQASSLGRKIVHRPVAETSPDLRVRLHAVWRKSGESRQMFDFIKLIEERGME